MVQFPHTAHCTRLVMFHEDDIEWVGATGNLETRFSRCVGPEELRNGEVMK